jgi:hypothetical protein
MNYNALNLSIYTSGSTILAYFLLFYVGFVSFLYAMYAIFTWFLCWFICCYPKHLISIAVWVLMDFYGSPTKWWDGFPYRPWPKAWGGCHDIWSITDLYDIAESQYTTVWYEVVSSTIGGELLRTPALTLHEAARRFIDFLQWENEKWFAFGVLNGPTYVSQRLHLHAHLLFRKVFCAHVLMFKCVWDAWFCRDLASHLIYFHCRCTRFCRIWETRFHHIQMYSRYSMPYDIVPLLSYGRVGFSAIPGGPSDQFFINREKLALGGLCQSTWIVSNLNSAGWGTIFMDPLFRRFFFQWFEMVDFAV